MKTTIIISVYKDVEALDLILNSLLNQTKEVDEIIISEDGNCEEMKSYFSTLNDQQIKHLSQEDNGWQKNKALNRAIHVSNNDYLIFIDGDCVPYPTFIESHITLAKENAVLCGRRTEPGESFSKQLRTKKLSVKEFVSRYVSNYFKLKNDNIRHYDDGICFHPTSFVLKLIKKFRKKENHIVDKE